MASFLQERAYRAENLDGGMVAWKEAGLPMVCDEAIARVVEE